MIARKSHVVDSNLSVVHMLIVILLVNLVYGFLVSIQIQNYQHGHLNLLLMQDLQSGLRIDNKLTWKHILQAK